MARRLGGNSISYFRFSGLQPVVQLKMEPVAITFSKMASCCSLSRRAREILECSMRGNDTFGAWMESTHPFGKLSLHSQPFHCGGSAWKSTFSASTWPRLCFNFTAWNQLDQLTQATDPKGLPTSYQRNANGEVTGWGDAVGTSTAITRDALGRPLRSQHAPGQIASLSYDKGPVGYLSAVEDQSGLTPYERDAQGRIRSKNQAVNDKPNVPGYF